MKICLVGTNLFHVNRQMDRHGEANSCCLPYETPQIEFPRIRSKLNSRMSVTSKLRIVSTGSYRVNFKTAL
jgi:hypothetical protein